MCKNHIDFDTMSHLMMAARRENNGIYDNQ